MGALEVLESIKRCGLNMVDLKFVDLLGQWQHFTIPISEIDEDSLRAGFGFDGSSLRGFQKIHESDMILIPDLSTSFIDPFSNKTLSLIGDIRDPVKNSFYSRDPRYISKKAEQYLLEKGIADVSYWGPEAEFFIFDHVRFNQSMNEAFYHIDSEEGSWNSGHEKHSPENGDLTRNLGYKVRSKEGYFPVAPHDSLQNIRNDICTTLESCGIRVEFHHHEVATAGQCEIDMRFQSLTKMADQVMTYKYVVKNIARKYNKTATFMPKPLFGDNGSGMHVHQSLWKNGKNLFYDPAGYAGLSEMGLYYVGGLLKHAHALCAFIAPTTNSYKRLAPGYEAPVNLAYGSRNRSAAIRIPMLSKSEQAKRIEFRMPDPTCNPYIGFPAMLMAGLDGIKHKIHPGEPISADIYEMSSEEAKHIKSAPSSLKEAIDALEADHDFLLEGNVFTKDVLDTWIDWKINKELDPMRLRPHPYEFHLYYDA
ncbi:MAG: type I glutamate--ammonia ligase [Candidatus Diapherotrites archaeon]|nr:type I glutamate--ammonia ligase [Candidatus Diapherotrites archaeon]